MKKQTQKETSKFEQWKTAVKNTPPERLLKISMQGYVLQSIGLLVVCIMLLINGTWWWLVFAFIFGIWNNVSGFISTWKQYDELKKLKEELALSGVKDTSPHRNKAEIIKSRLGVKAAWLSALISIFISYFGVSSFGWEWYHKTITIILALVLYYFIYFKGIYKLTQRLDNGK